MKGVYGVSISLAMLTLSGEDNNWGWFQCKCPEILLQQTMCRNSPNHSPCPTLFADLQPGHELCGVNNFSFTPNNRSEWRGYFNHSHFEIFQAFSKSCGTRKLSSFKGVVLPLSVMVW